MHKYFVSSRVHYCRLDDGIVMLDLKSGKYLSVGNEELTALAPIVDEWGALSSESCRAVTRESLDFAETLVAAGVFVRECPPSRSFSSAGYHCTAEVDWDPFNPASRKIRSIDVIRLLFAFVKSMILLRTRSLGTIFDSTHTRKLRESAGSRAPTIDEAAELARLFRRMRPALFSAKYKCLLESLVLVEFLAQYKTFPSWIIGVRSRPFAAHSWVVYDGTLLTGNVDNTKAYAPLLSV